MAAEWVVPLGFLGCALLGVWTFWSLNAGRRMARWGRRKLRRTLFLVLAAAAAFAALAN